MPSVHYVYEKLWVALSSLIRSGSIQDRLFSASSNLVILQPEDFPISQWSDVDLRGTFSEMMQALTRAEPEGSEGTLRAAMNIMSDEEAEQWARKIFWLFTEIAEIEAQSHLPPESVPERSPKVSETWIGRMVEVEFDSQDRGDNTRSGWLIGMSHEGIRFAKSFYSDTLHWQMPERTQFYPWAFIRNVRLKEDD